jgi:hypothetical protein
MLDLRLSIEATQDAITGTQPTVSNDGLSQPPALVTKPQPPVLVTEQEVMFGTAAAVRPRSTPITSRMTGALRVVAAAFPPGPTTLIAPGTSRTPGCHEKWTDYKPPWRARNISTSSSRDSAPRRWYA